MVDTDHLQKTFIKITGDISNGNTKDLKSIEMFNEACLIKWHVYISFLASKTTHQLKHKNIEKTFEIFAEKERYNFKGGEEINQESYQNYYVK